MIGSIDWAALEAVRVGVGELVVFAGALLAVIGAVGVLRFPDVYTRVHAASVTDTGSVTVMLLGMVLISGWSQISLKLAFIWFFLFLTGPVGSHALVNAAYTARIQPLVGRYGRGWTSGEGGKEVRP
jgi:multicomponent Na+:H+ antiporter subunit G